MRRYHREYKQKIKAGKGLGHDSQRVTSSVRRGCSLNYMDLHGVLQVNEDPVPYPLASYGGLVNPVENFHNGINARVELMDFRDTSFLYLEDNIF